MKLKYLPLVILAVSILVLNSARATTTTPQATLPPADTNALKNDLGVTLPEVASPANFPPPGVTWEYPNGTIIIGTQGGGAVVEFPDGNYVIFYPTGEIYVLLTNGWGGVFPPGSDEPILYPPPGQDPNIMPGSDVPSPEPPLLPPEYWIRYYQKYPNPLLRASGPVGPG